MTCATFCTRKNVCSPCLVCLCVRPFFYIFFCLPPNGCGGWFFYHGLTFGVKLVREPTTPTTRCIVFVFGLQFAGRGGGGVAWSIPHIDRYSQQAAPGTTNHVPSRRSFMENHFHPIVWCVFVAFTAFSEEFQYFQHQHTKNFYSSRTNPRLLQQDILPSLQKMTYMPPSLAPCYTWKPHLALLTAVRLLWIQLFSSLQPRAWDFERVEAVRTFAERALRYVCTPSGGRWNRHPKLARFALWCVGVVYIQYTPTQNRTPDVLCVCREDVRKRLHLCTGVRGEAEIACTKHTSPS